MKLRRVAHLINNVSAILDNSTSARMRGGSGVWRMTSFVSRYTQAPVRLAIEAAALVDFLSRTHNDFEGRLLEGLSKVLAQNVRVYVYPTATSAMQDSRLSASTAGWQWEEKTGLITVMR
jgi:hypothetical protein